MKRKITNEEKQKAEQFCKERNAAVMSFDVPKFRAFYQKYRDMGWYDLDLPDNDLIVEVIMRKMACNITKLPIETRIEAKQWLAQRGFSSDI